MAVTNKKAPASITVEFLRPAHAVPFRADESKHCEAGSTLEVDYHEGKYMIACGTAKEAAEKKAELEKKSK